jgi:hypothetical protein
MKLITRLIIATILAFLICNLLFVVSSKVLAKYNIHKTERLSEIFMNNTPYDMIFIGSSRTHTTINPAVIDSVCKLNSYNAGVEGGNLHEFKLTLDGYLTNHPPPKYLILTIDILSFDLRKKIFNYTQYLPYTNNKEVKERLHESGHNTLMFQLFPFLQLTAYDDHTRGNIIKGLIGQNELPEGDIQHKGYLSNTGNRLNESSIKPVSPSKKAEITKEGLLILNNIIETCKANNIKIIFTYAPEYQKQNQNTFVNKDEFFKTIQALALAHNITYMRHDELIMCQDANLFANVSHVNKIGADVYSHILADQLNTVIN